MKLRYSCILGICFSIFSATANSEPSTVVRESEVGKDWPLKVSEATIECRELGRIVLKANGRTYWLNGLAKGAAWKNGWADLVDIWLDDPKLISLGIPEAKKSISPVLDRGVKLCNKVDP